MTYLIHVANVLYLLSYLVKDILWLRLLTVLGGLVLLAYFVLQPNPAWTAAAWNTLFFFINIWQIRLLLLERRPVHLRPEEQHLYQLSFRRLTLREFAKVLALGKWQEVAAGTRLVHRDEDLDRVMVIASGRVRIELEGAPVRELPAGCFIGEMSFLTGKRPNADVVTIEATRVVAFPRETLRALLSDNVELRAAVQSAIGEDLIAKLRPA
jgi:hypothetical protein